ncbi:MAG: tetratricopeptide repeat protein [Treponema sp.]|nr:tetratricopeptide repeat protein [Treponema sp.]
MKKICFLTVAAAAAVIFLAGCGATKVENPETEKPENPVVEKENTEEKVEETTVEEVISEPEFIPEPEDPANIKFAKDLQAALKAGKINDAIALFDTLPAELEGDLDLKMVLASLYVSTGDYDNALSVAQAILAIDPNHKDAQELVVMVARAKGDTSAYKTAAKQILARDPYNASINIMEGEDYALNKKYKQAKESYKKALKSEPENEDALYGFAQMSYFTNDLKSARNTTQQILDSNPENSAALAFMGKLAAEESNYAKAAKLTRQAIEYEPANYIYYLDLGNYLAQQGKYSEAITAWDVCVDLDPSYFLAYAYRAGCYDEQGKFEEALENYRMVIKTNPKYYYAYESTAMLEYHFGNFEQARKYFDAAYGYSKNWCYKLLSGITYFKQGNQLEAKKSLQQLLKTLERDSVEYDLVRLFCDTYSRNAETNLLGKIKKIDNNTKKGRMQFYMGLYYEVNGSMEAANEYYTKVTNMQAPMFFEYRLAEWSLGL